MTDSKKYFISLISSFLNDNPPPAPLENADWKEIYNLANIHCVTAIIANEIAKLPKQTHPDSELLSYFKQQLGYTIISCENKAKIAQDIKNIFLQNEISFLIVKGAILRDYYPVSQLRSSGDIDFIIKEDDFERAKALFSGEQYRNVSSTAACLVFDIGGDHIEIHNSSDYDNKFFSDIFSLAENNGYEYCLNDDIHLIYVLCHIAKHFSYLGAGIRMFMDIDVMIRHMGKTFDYEKILSLCEQANIAVLAKTVFSLCNLWFNTPVKCEVDLNDDAELLSLLESVIIDGGSFGYSSGGIGDYYIKESMGKDAKNNVFVKIKALFKLLFPSIAYLRRTYIYSNKHPILVPFAWFNRLYDGIFKRRKNSKKTLNSIFSNNEYSQTHKKLLNELGLS